MFGEIFIGEIPATDPKSLLNRNLEVSLSQLLKNPSKYYAKLVFRTERVEEKNVYTRFNGYVVLKEYISRFIRKRLDKVYLNTDVETKDNWKLRMKMVLILNRNTYSNIRTGARKRAETLLKELVGKTNLDGLMKDIISAALQKSIKKQCHKTYPVRIVEVSKIEVKKVA